MAGDSSTHRKKPSPTVAEAGSEAREELRSRVALLCREVAYSTDDDHARERARDELARLHQPLVAHLARRFRDRGEPLEDLIQVGMLGLVKAIDRFDPEREVEFATYATPTVIGEIKRYFRDHAWALRVPRRVQEFRQAVSRATEDLTHDLRRPPTVHELAQHLKVGDEDVLEALESTHAYQTLPLDPAADPEDEAPSLVNRLGVDDQGLEEVERREVLRPLLAELPERERRIIELRFVHHRTQSQIADDIGLSQMHVSRLLTRTLAQLRQQLTQNL